MVHLHSMWPSMEPGPQDELVSAPKCMAWDAATLTDMISGCRASLP